MRCVRARACVEREKVLMIWYFHCESIKKIVSARFLVARSVIVEC